MKTSRKIGIFMGIFLATMLISNVLGASSDYIGVCPGATLEYDITKDHFSLGYPTQKWNITIASIEEGVNLVGSRPGMILYTEVTGQNITDLYYNDHMFVYQNQSEMDDQWICTREIKWVIHTNLGGQNHTYGQTILNYDSDGVLETGILKKAEGSWMATYVIVRTSITLGNCTTLPGYSVEFLTFCIMLAVSFQILKVSHKKKG
jgi:hypothetical protein